MEKNFDIFHLMNKNKFNHIGLSNTGRHWNSLPKDYICLQRFCGNFMSNQLDSATYFNFYDSLSDPYQHVGTSSITTESLIRRRVDPRRDNSGLVRWSWKLFRGIGEASLYIVTFYIPVPPTTGRDPISVYIQHMTHFSNLRRREFPSFFSLSDLSEDIKPGKQRKPNNINRGHKRIQSKKKSGYSPPN